ncbi:MAG TPA: hypothetical protein VHK91_18220 [Flavisolibacter sp.]|jgi:hypothetical protein|nr:hypothetical protein [Flavisolibacter sp.]
MKNTLIVLLISTLWVSCKKPAPDNDPETAPEPVGACAATKADLESMAIFPADNPWNTDISTAPLDPASSQITAAFSANSIKADFGSGTWEGSPIGIPYVAVCSAQPKVSVYFTDYGDESDKGPYAIPLSAPIEGNGTGDSHVLAVDKENHILYELFNAHVRNGRWEASSGAIFDLTSNTLRPESWTSADAAGLPIFPGLIRYEEILKGTIDHAIRFTLTSNNVQPAYIFPARHKVNSTGGAYSLPFGGRLRLKAGFDISGFSPQNQIILKAFKKYGLMLADIGSNLYISGAPDDRWNNDDLRKLGQLKGSDFEVISAK